MIKINLLPVREVQKKEKYREQIVVFVACTIFVLIGCGVAYTTILSKIGQKNKEIAAQTQLIEQLKKQIGEVEKVKKLQGELQSKLEILGKLKANKTGPAHLLDELSAATPDRVWIESFDGQDEKISLSGTGVSEEVVATFLRQLDTSAYYKNVELQSLNQATIEGNNLQKFKIGAREESPPVAKVDKDKAVGKLSDPAKELQGSY